MNNNDDPIAKLDAIEEVDITKIKPRTKSKFETIRDQIGDQMFDDLMADFGAEDMTQLESLADAKKEAFYASAREAYKTIKRGE